MQELLQYIFSGLTNGAIYAVIALGFSILYGATRLINFAHGEFVMLGALGLISLWQGLKVPLAIALVLAVLGVALIGFLFERLAIRTVSRPEPIVLIIITVGASIFLRGVGMMVWGKDAHSAPAFFSFAPIDVMGAKLLAQSIWILGVVVALTFALHAFFKKTLIGKAMTAASISKKAAWLTGIPYEWMILLAFVLSTATGAVAGVIITPITMCSYDMGTLLGLKGFCSAMLGGLGSLWGALAGGIVLGVLESLGAGFLSSGYKDAIAFALLLAILYIRPSGIFGAKELHRF